MDQTQRKSNSVTFQGGWRQSNTVEENLKKMRAEVGYTRLRAQSNADVSKISVQLNLRSDDIATNFNQVWCSVCGAATPDSRILSPKPWRGPLKVAGGQSASCIAARALIPGENSTDQRQHKETPKNSLFYKWTLKELKKEYRSYKKLMEEEKRTFMHTENTF